MTNYNDGKWHGWNGGSCPVHTQSQVEYIFWRQGTHSSLYRETAGVLKWEGDVHGNVIAFRVVKEYKEPREWWVNVYESGLGSLWDTKERAETNASKSGKLLETIKVREVIE